MSLTPVLASSPAPRSRSIWGASLTLALITLNVLVFIYQSSLSPEQLEQFFLRWSAVPMEIVEWTDLPPTVPFPIAGTLVSALFLHTSLAHLVLNMVLLAVFGLPIERLAGARWLLAFYLAGGIVGSLAQIIANPLTLASLVGASGAIAALIGAMLLLPRAPHQTFIMVAWGAMQITALIEELATIRWISGGLAIWSHIGGFAAGVTVALILRHVRRAGAAVQPHSPVHLNP